MTASSAVCRSDSGEVGSGAALGDADGLVTTEGTLYPLLGRLRRDGVVDTPGANRPRGPRAVTTASPQTAKPRSAAS